MMKLNESDLQPHPELKSPQHLENLEGIDFWDGLLDLDLDPGCFPPL